MKQIYIHYGARTYNPELVTLKKKKHIYSKPAMGLWGSPLRKDVYSWYEWCKNEDFRTETLKEYFKFSIKEEGKILNVRKEEDIVPYLEQDPNGLKLFGLTSVSDKLKDDIYEKFDGIELFLSNNWSLRDGVFYTWDVDSIVVWNPDVIQIEGA